MSALALIPDADREEGMHRLRADLDSGEWHRRWGHLLGLDELDLGYRVVVAAPDRQPGCASLIRRQLNQAPVRRHDMARISYDDQTAAAYKAVREIPRDGLGAWRDAVQPHLRPSPRMTMVDIGAGTGAFATAFSDWFDLSSSRSNRRRRCGPRFRAARAFRYLRETPALSRSQTAR